MPRFQAPARRSAALALLSALLAPPILAAQEIVGRQETSFSISHRIGAGDWVRVASPHGFIRVTQGGSQVEIQADKEVRQGSVEDVGFVVHRGSEGITVCAVYDDEDTCGADGDYRSGKRRRGWWRDHQVKVNFTVRVPADARIKVGTGNGDVSVDGGGAEVVAASGNGRVEVSGTTGEVRASSGNGRITVEGAQGAVDASSGNGDIRVSTSLGPVTATSGNGSIDVVMDRLEGSPDMEFTTGNGRITVSVPEGFGAELQSITGNGRVLVDFPIQMRGRIDPSRVRGTIGKGGGRLTMTTGNGDLEIQRRD
jgi:hypothetical protein